MTVTRATAMDLDGLTTLFDAYRVFYRQPSDPARARSFMADRLEEGDSVILVARRAGRLAGFVQLYPSYSSVRTARVWILNDLFVDQSFRRSGVARDLLIGSADWAAASGAAGLVLETEKTNAAAKALYESLGWRIDLVTDRYELAFDHA